MSSAEPFMPAHESPSPSGAADRDIDHDTDVIVDPEDAESTDAPYESDTKPAFRTPQPGDRLTEDELDRDLDD
ncbi:hypothetical protein [Microbacterium sp. P02]|uniref:hypothetical protein n=1 Tax=unclassified Microbacterium TaxID=2609290 RepID=UPI00366AA0E6